MKKPIFGMLFRAWMKRLLFLLLLSGSLEAGDIRVIEPTENPHISSDGTISIRWESELEGATFVLERSGASDFSEIEKVYDGPDLGTFVSGQMQGTQYYRLRAFDADGNPIGVSEPFVVNVEFVSMRTVGILMLSGLFTFILIIFTILKGFRQYRDAGKEYA